MRVLTQTLRSRSRGFLLNEALVYIGLVFVILGTGYFVTYRAIENSVMLRKNAEDIAAAMRAGERWRNDVRTATQIRVASDSAPGVVVRMTTGEGDIVYRLEGNVVFRSVGNAPEVRLLENVKAFTMQPDPRRRVTPWRWEVELLPRAKGYSRPSRIQPLFTFTAIPAREVGL